jgi:uncharacterized membrane protein
MTVIAFAMLHTRTGRQLMLIGWVTLLGILALNLVYIDFNWETMKSMFIALVVGAMWFVDWNRIVQKWRKETALSSSHATQMEPR